MPARTVEVRITGSTKDLEAALERAGYVAKQSGDRIGTAFNEGTSKAGGALSHLGRTAESFGVPFAGSLSLIGKHLDETTTKTQKLHSALSEAGKVTLIAGGAGLAAVGAEAIKLGTSYETAQAKIQASTNVSKKSAESLTHAFGQTAGSSMESGQKMEAAYAEVAGQLKVTEGHALSTAEAMRVSSAANDLSEGTASNLAAAYASVARTMQAFHLPATQAAQASDVLYNTSRALNIPVEQVATSMGRLHSRLGEVAPSMGDIGGLMVALGGRGVQGSRGLQVVNTAFQTLIGGGKKTTEVLNDLGVHVFDQNGKFVGLQSVISQLQPKLAGLTQQQRLFAEQTLFGKGAAQIMGQVVMQGVPAFQHSAEAATRAGSAHQAAAAQMHTLSGEAKVLKASLETVGGDLGLILIPKLETVAHATAEVIQWFEKHKAAAEALGVVITGVLGTAVSIYAYDKAVAFVKGTQRMIEGLTSLAGTATGTAATVEAAEGSEAAAVEGADAAMVTANATASSSFAALGSTALAVLGKIAAAFVAAEAAAHAFGAVLNALGAEAPESLSELLGGGQKGEGGIASADKNAGAMAEKYSHQEEARLANTSRNAMTIAAAKKFGISPGVLWGIYGNETSYGANITTSSAGAEGAFQFIPSTAKEYGYPLTNRPTPAQFKQQAEAAARYMSVLIREHGGNVSAALEAYSGNTPGYAEAALQKAGSVPSGGNAAIEQMMHEAASGKTKASGQKKREAEAKKLAEMYVEPFVHATGVHRSRTDQGVDFSFGGKLGAIGAGEITVKDFEGFGETIVEKLTGGKEKGQYIYTGLETGGKGLVHTGQHVSAGQAIAQGYGSGGIEMGFATPYGLPITPYKPGESHEDNPTVGGKLFSKFLATLGKGGSSLNVANAEVTEAEKAAKKQEALLKHLEASGGGELKRLEGAIQTGTARNLEKLLGYSPEHTQGKGSEAYKQFETLISALKDAHVKGLKELADKLVAAHKQALGALHTALVAEQEKADARGLQLQAVELRDQTTLTADMAAKVTEAMKLASQQMVDWITSAATALKDAGQQITDSFQATATAIRDATTEMTTATDAKVQAIQDASKTTVDTLGERGLYGLNLVAQQEQVALDKTTTGFDAQIAHAEMAVDHAQTSTDKASAAAQAYVDAITAQQDVLVGFAKNHLDNIKSEENSAIQNAQQNLDNVTKSTDAAVQSAQNAVDAAATGTQAQQQAAAALLAKAQAEQSSQVATAQAALSAAQNASNSAIASAENAVSQAEAHASVAEGEASNALATVHGNAEVVLANANQILAGVQGQAKVAEAEQTELIEKTKAQASTEYAGSGMQINIVGLNPTDGAVVASEVSWALLNRVPTPA